MAKLTSTDIYGSLYVQGVTALDSTLSATQLTSTTTTSAPFSVLSRILVDNLNVELLDGQQGSYYRNWANITNKPDPKITLAGDLSGSVTLTDLGSGTLTATIADNSVALGTKTTGNYVATVSGITNGGLSISGSGSENAAVTVGHSNILGAAGSRSGSSGTVAFGGTISIPSISYDINGHITSTTTTSVTLPANPNSWRPVEVNNVSIGTNTLDLTDGTNVTLSNNAGVVTFNSPSLSKGTDSGSGFVTDVGVSGHQITLTKSSAVTSVAAGNGMNFTTITGTGSVVMGTPSTLTNATTNAVTATSHTHAITTYDVSGTANQITVSGSPKVLGSATTLSLPQNIHTGATPTFGRLTLTQAMTAGTTAAFTNPHLALVPTNQVDSTGFVGMTFATSTSANYGFSLGALRSTDGSGSLVIRNHNNNATGTEIFRLDAAGNLTIPGKMVVSETEVSSTSNGVLFEGSVADDFEGLLKAGTLTADRTYTLPDASGTIALTNQIPSISVIDSGTGAFVTDVTSSGHTITLSRGNFTETALSLGTQGTGDFITGISVSGHQISYTKGNETHLSLSTTGSGNAITSISVSDHAITATKGTTFLTVESDTLNSVTSRGNTTTNNLSIGALTLTGSLTSGGGPTYSNYVAGADNIILKGNATGVSGLFFESEKDGTAINHPSDYAFIQYHPYGIGGLAGEAGRLVIGISNDATTDKIVLNPPGANDLTVRLGVGTTEYQVWHEANDGSGSGLDADLLDGLNSASTNTVSTIVARDSNGDFASRNIALAGSVTVGSSTVNGANSGTMKYDSTSKSIKFTFA